MTAYGAAMLLAVVVAILLVILTVWRLVLDVLLLQDLRPHPRGPTVRPLPALPAPETWPGAAAGGGAAGDAAGGRGGGDGDDGGVADADLLDAVDFAE